MNELVSIDAPQYLNSILIEIRKERSVCFSLSVEKELEEFENRFVVNHRFFANMPPLFTFSRAHVILFTYAQNGELSRNL